MSQKPAEVRVVFGQALRRLRLEHRLSLDDIQSSTARFGVRVTRSHLSRVETGQAELTLPRFLSFLHALGESPAALTEQFSALLSVNGTTKPALPHDADPLSAAQHFRARGMHQPEALDAEALIEWAGVEAHLGRWRSAERLLQLRLEEAPDDTTVALLAVSALGAGHAALASVLTDITPAVAAPPRRLARAACLLLLQRSPGAAAQIATDGARVWPPAARALGFVLAAHAYQQGGQTRAAREAAARARDHAPDALSQVEALLQSARIETASAHAAPALRLVERARALARDLAVPDLVARCHLESSRLWRLSGDRNAAHVALRAARAIRRRSVAQGEPLPLPLHGLFSVARAAARESAKTELQTPSSAGS